MRWWKTASNTYLLALVLDLGVISKLGLFIIPAVFAENTTVPSLAAMEHDYSIAQHHIRPPIDNMDGTKSVPGDIKEYSLDKLRGFAKFFCN